MSKQRAARIFAGVIIGLGLCSMIFVFGKANLFRLNYPFLMLAIFAIGLRVRRSSDFDELRSDALVSGSFVALAFLLYGGASAVLIAVADALLSSIRSSRSKLSFGFHVGLAALSTFLPALIVKQIIYPNIIDEIHHGNYANLFVALGIFTVIRFAISGGGAAIMSALSDDTTVKAPHVWSAITYTVAAVIAGFMAVLVDEIGFRVVFASIPIVIFVFLTNRMHLKNIEISRAKADESKRYAETLELQAQALRESEERFRTAFDFAPIGIAIISEDRYWLKVNHALCELIGFDRHELLGCQIGEFFHPDDRERCEMSIAEVAAGTKSSFESELRLVCSDGRSVWISASAASISAKDMHPQIILQVQDVTDRRMAAEKLRFEAKHDGLTGLPNRNHFIAELETALERFKADPVGSALSVLFIDLDRFKLINDNHGHLVGDRLLTQISHRLKNCLRPGDMLARLAGDEFTVLIEGARNLDDVVAVATKIEKQFAEPFIIDGLEVFSSASIGILKGREYHSSVEELLRDADVAMYQAKTAGRARYEIFDRQAHLEVKETFKIEGELRSAIGRNELTTAYQPIYSLKTGRIEGFEALARWHHPIEGFVPPDKFIPIAEDSGLITQLGEQILRRACFDAAKFINSGHTVDDFTMSVNVSCKQMTDYSMVESMLRILDETGLDARRLRLEITESAFCEHPDRGIEILYRIRDLGVGISIDDFGTGYSNLTNLARLPVSALKLDRSFVSTMDVDPQHRTIVQSILGMARGLGLSTVAEGVETTRQLGMLTEVGCDFVQGYLLSKPVPFEKALGLLATADEATAIPTLTTEVSSSFSVH